jgi:hypothetical protein
LFESQNGAVTAVYFGFRPVNSTLELTFTNITDDKAQELINHYKRCNRADGNGEWNYAVLPQDASGPLAGIGDATLQDAMGENLENRNWRYAQSPQLISTFPGYSTVVVSLIGMMESAGARVD